MYNYIPYNEEDIVNIDHLRFTQFSMFSTLTRAPIN
jgi:hypothetical protein